jgi:protein disulfide-isomerase
MKQIPIITLALVLALFSGCSPKESSTATNSPAVELPWQTDLPKALALAKSENKAVLMDFTGSDWCPGCIAFHKEVALSPQFAAYANTNLVLVEVDFPEKKPQSDELKAANTVLQKNYAVEGFPTLILLNADGKEIGRQLGYDSEKPEVFIAKLEKFSKP